MSKVHPDILNYFLKIYEDRRSAPSMFARIGSTISNITHSSSADVIQENIATLKTLIKKIDHDPNIIVNVLLMLGKIGRISQQNKLMSVTSSECHRMAFAACSYIIYTINNDPNQNKDFSEAISLAVHNMNKDYEKMIDEYNAHDPSAIEASNKRLDELICDLATLGNYKRLLISQRIPDLYGHVEMPQSSAYNSVSKYNCKLPFILHHEYFVHDYLKVEHTDLPTFINRAHAEFASSKSEAVDKQAGANNTASSKSEAVDKLASANNTTPVQSPKLSSSSFGSSNSLFRRDLNPSKDEESKTPVIYSASENVLRL